MSGGGYGVAQKGARLPKQKNRKVLIRVGERALTTSYCNGSSTLDSAPGWETGRRQLGVTGNEAMVIEWWRDISWADYFRPRCIPMQRICAEGPRRHHTSITNS